jgi:non-specific serine/threonine protein kinase
LVDQSLLLHEEQADGEPRFAMLETIREFGLEQLAANGDAELLQQRHAAWCEVLAIQAEEELAGPEQATWLSRLEAELGNLRTALDWAISCGDADSGQRLASALTRFWDARGHLSEGRGWLERVLTIDADPNTSRARALVGAAVLARKQGDYAHAGESYEAALTIFRAVGDRSNVAVSLTNLGVVAQDQGEFDRAAALHEEALTLFRDLGDRARVAASLNNLGIVARRRGNLARAMALYEEALDLWRDLGDAQRIALGLNNLGVVAYGQGDDVRAASLYEDALALWRELGDKWGTALSLSNLAEVLYDQGNHQQAVGYYQESLVLRREQGDQMGIAECLAGLAGVAVALGRPAQAARLYGAAEALREAIGTPLPPTERETQERTVAEIRARLSEREFNAAWLAGRALSAEHAVAAALDVSPRPPETAALPTESAAGKGLTRRELEVLRLLVEGRSDREIGEALYISHRTAMTHVNNILQKLGLDSRTAAATYAVRNGLV